MFTNMVTVMRDFLDSFYIPNFQIMDFIEIAIIVLSLYYILKSVKKTRAWILMKGILLLIVIYFISYLCGFNAITVIFEKSIYFLAVGIILILQPELRKLFESLGVKKVNPFNNSFKKKDKFENRFSDKTATEIVDACRVLSRTKTGALIVIEKDIPLKDYINSGIMVDAFITKELLINTFEHNTPLHDGAVIISNDKLTAATCYLPLSSDDSINKAYGTRHRAAIGMSEETDALVVVVSEETGHITVAYGAQLFKDLTPEQLLEHLHNFQKTEKEVEKQSFRKRYFKNFNIKFLSLFIGLSSWLLLMNVFDPVISKPFNNIPINVINESLVESAGQSYHLAGESLVDIVVKDRRSVVETLENSDIVIFADMKNLSVLNTIPLYGSINKAPEAIIDFGYNSNVQIEFEDIISKDFKVEVSTMGIAANGYYVAETKPNISTVTITGPRSQINMVNKVVLPIDINGVEKDFNLGVTPVIYDVNGKISDKLEINAGTIYVSGTVYKTKVVDLIVQINTEDKLSYTIKDFSYSPEEIKIAAKDDIIETTESIVVVVDVPIDESKINNGKYISDITLGDYMDDSIILVNKAASITLTLEIENYVEKEMTLSSADITVSNLPSNYVAVPYFNSLKFKIWVPVEWADTILVKDISPKINAENAVEGLNSFTVTFVSDLIKLESDVIVDYFVIIDKQ